MVGHAEIYAQGEDVRLRHEAVLVELRIYQVATRYEVANLANTGLPPIKSVGFPAHFVNSIFQIAAKAVG